MESNEILNAQRLYALLHQVPILRESEVHLFEELISLYRPKNILEVGTAIGYSTLLLARQMAKDGHITSLELDGERYAKAQEYLSHSPYAKQITLLHGDAMELLQTIQGGPFDLIFLDGPKGQYLRHLELILPHLAPQAVVLADNVLFRGYVRGDKEVPHRFRTIVRRLQAYLEFVENRDLFNTTIYPMGDGMSVSIWKGEKDENNDSKKTD